MIAIEGDIVRLTERERKSSLWPARALGEMRVVAVRLVGDMWYGALITCECLALGQSVVVAREVELEKVLFPHPDWVGRRLGTE